MKKTALLFIGIALGTTCVSAQENTSVSGYIDGFGNDRLFVFSVSVSDPSIHSTDTIDSRNGSFALEKHVDEAMECDIYSNGCYLNRASGKRYLPETNVIKVMLFPNQELEVTGSLTANGLDYQTKGNAFNEVLSKRRSEQLWQAHALVEEYLRLDSMEFKGVPRAQLDKLDAELSLRKNKLKASDLLYIKEHPDQDLSAFYVINLPQDSFMKYLRFISPSVRNGTFKKRLDAMESNFKSVEVIRTAQQKVAIGTQAPDFTLISLTKNPVKLSSLKGKYVVLDFWGSWCHWCMTGIPKMKEYYAKYKSKVEFVGINVRDSEADWVKTVKNEGLNWIQLQNLTTADVPAIYGVSGYPTKIILDPQQKIVAKIVGEDSEFYTQLDKILAPKK